MIIARRPRRANAAKGTIQSAYQGWSVGENNKSASWYNGARSVVLAVQRQPGTNTVAVAEKVQAEMDRLSIEATASKLVALGYPEALRNMHFRAHFPIRGLLVEARSIASISARRRLRVTSVPVRASSRRRR